MQNEYLSDDFKAGQAYERGILRRVLSDRPGLMSNDDYLKMTIWMRELRERFPPVTEAA